MGALYLKIDPDTMTLDMGEANKRLRITSDGIQQLFGFPHGGHSALRPSEDGYDDALMRLRSELGISTNQDIRTMDLRNKLKVLVNDPTKDDLAPRVFFIIVFMKVVLPSPATRVSREAEMFENLVIEDMANMDYCQLMVDELRRAVVRYQDSATMGKAITGCAIGPVLMYLDCLIRGKVPEIDMRVPHLCFMDQDKLLDLADADLIRKGDGDPRTWVFGKLLWKTQEEVVFFRVYKRPVLEMPSQVHRIVSPQDELRAGRRDDGAGDILPGPSNASTSKSTSFGIDVAIFGLERVGHIFVNVRSVLEKVPTIVERLSRIDGILPDGHRFNADESSDYVDMERLLLGEMRDGVGLLIQSSTRVLNTVKHFRTLQDSCCKSFEEDVDVVIKQMEQHEAATRRTVDDANATISEHRDKDVVLESHGLEEKTHGVEADVVFSVVKQMELNDASAGRDGNDTEANVSEHHDNDGLEEAKQYGEFVAVDSGVDDIAADKGKLYLLMFFLHEAKQYSESGVVDSGVDDIAADKINFSFLFDGGGQAIC